MSKGFTQLGTRCNQCGSLARVRTSREISRNYREAYFVCRNEACQHEFVASISFLRTLVEPVRQVADMASFVADAAVKAVAAETHPQLPMFEPGQ